MKRYTYIHIYIHVPTQPPRRFILRLFLVIIIIPLLITIVIIVPVPISFQTFYRTSKHLLVFLITQHAKRLPYGADTRIYIYLHLYCSRCHWAISNVIHSHHSDACIMFIAFNGHIPMMLKLCKHLPSIIL